jgi:hypothetical protein
MSIKGYSSKMMKGSSNSASRSVVPALNIRCWVMGAACAASILDPVPGDEGVACAAALHYCAHGSA